MAGAIVTRKINSFPEKVVTRICGGLGNQMFCYAVGEQLARRYGIFQQLDLIEYFSSKYLVNKGISTRQYQLDNFTGPRRYEKWPIWKSLMLFAASAIDLVFHHRFYERALNFFGYHLHCSHDQFFADADADAHGKRKIYSTWLMFSTDRMPARSVLRQEFALAVSLKPANARCLERIRGCTSVSIHVRRTDYLVQSTPWDLSWNYYRLAIDEMSGRVEGPHWFVFSDDPEWCREKFSFLKDVEIVAGNDDCPWEDLELMKACRHHIIANSTFSWWGAYLSDTVNGVTMYPRRWGPYAPKELPSTFIPLEWIGIS